MVNPKFTSQFSKNIDWLAFHSLYTCCFTFGTVDNRIFCIKCIKSIFQIKSQLLYCSSKIRLLSIHGANLALWITR